MLVFFFLLYFILFFFLIILFFLFFFFFFFQAEDGIRDLTVTGVQTCALPISTAPSSHWTGPAAPSAPVPRARAAPSRSCPSPSPAPRARSGTARSSARPRRSPGGVSRSRCAAGSPLRPPGRSPCRGGTGRRCSDATASPPRPRRCP